MTAESESVSPPKYGRGKNPNSLKNLRKPWEPGESGRGVHTGPMVGPALRRYACVPLKVLKALDLDELPAIDAVAVASLRKGIDVDWGDRTREFLASRLDGDKPDVSIAIQQNNTTTHVEINEREEIGRFIAALAETGLLEAPGAAAYEVHPLAPNTKATPLPAAQ